MAKKASPLLMQQMQFGAADAETEASLDGGAFLPAVFFDPFFTLQGIKNGRFVIAGKKGTGKSEFVYSLKCKPDASRFIKIMKFRNFEIQPIIEDLKQPNDEANQKAVWKWIILCSLLEMISGDQSLEVVNSQAHEFKLALKRIQGFTSIDGFQVREHIKKGSGQIELAAFKKIAGAIFSKAFETRETQSSFLNLITPFERLIMDLAKCSRDHRNTFLLCIDDLDEGFDGSIAKKDSIRTLLKVAKEYHADFNSAGLLFAPIILIRQDILSSLNIGDANLHKIISNNTQQFNWFHHSAFDGTPGFQPLKNLITLRINYSYQ